MNFPKTIKVGAHTIKIVFCELPDGTDGEFTTEDNTIKIDSRLAPSQKQVTLIHEIFHALNSQFDEDPYHALMESLAQQWFQVLRDNKLNFRE